MHRTITRALTVLTLVAAVLAGGAGVAAADPHHRATQELLREIEDDSYIGPDKRDYVCVFDVRVMGPSCRYAPGEGLSPQVLRDERAQKEGQLRWNPGKLWDRLTFWN